MVELILKELAYRVVGAAMAVHTALGPGYLEAVYHKALAYELTTRGITYQSKVKLPVSYRGMVVGEYEADFVVDDLMVVEIKATSAFHARHHAQVINYLAASRLRLALLLNFGAESLVHKRIVY